MKIAITADWHLDNMKRTYLIDGKPNREIDLDNQITYMKDHCIATNVELLIVAGDLFDKSYVTGYYFSKCIEYLRMFSDNGIRVLVVPGNHDATEAGGSITSALRRLRDENIRVVESISWCILPNSDFSILCLPHERKSKFEAFTNYTAYVKDFLKSKKRTNKEYMVIGHFQPLDAIPGSEESMFAGSTRFLDTSIFKTAPVFCGHIHKPQRLGNVVIPGSPVRFNMSEAKDSKRFVIYDTETKKGESVSLECQNMCYLQLNKTNMHDVFEFPENSIVGIELIVPKEQRSSIFQKDFSQRITEAGGRLTTFSVVTEESELRKVKKEKVGSMSPETILKNVIHTTVKGKKNKSRIYKTGLPILDNLKNDLEVEGVI